MTAAVSCPVCRGSIGTHAVRSLFTCHHCQWALQANTGDAFRRATIVGVLTVLLALCVAWLFALPIGAMLEIGVRGGGGLGVITATIAYRVALVLTPVRPQRARP